MNASRRRAELRKALFAFGVWLCVWPLVTGLLLAIRVTGLQLPLPVQTVAVSAVLVPIMIFGVVPVVRKILGDGP